MLDYIKTYKNKIELILSKWVAYKAHKRSMQGKILKPMLRIAERKVEVLRGKMASIGVDNSIKDRLIKGHRDNNHSVAIDSNNHNRGFHIWLTKM